MPDKVFNNNVISPETSPELIMQQEKTSKKQVMQVLAEKIFSTDKNKVKTNF